ncbi:hypothetical protein BY996DRAFT_6416332 [Phakopsora pachyrhizi]|nr:hypothetical protein BY996DRAFT_6416332 [Phakopsora pachyrhizi]
MYLVCKLWSAAVCACQELQATSWILKERRRAGIPDSDKRPFKIAKADVEEKQHVTSKSRDSDLRLRQPRGMTNFLDYCFKKVQVVKMSEYYADKLGSDFHRFREESVYDRGAGVWVREATIRSGPIDSGTYYFDWVSEGPRAQSDPRHQEINSLPKLQESQLPVPVVLINLIDIGQSQ